MTSPTPLDLGNAFEFDYFDQAQADVLPEVLAHLRATCPVAHSDAHGGAWIVSKYDDVMEIVQDPARFSSRYVGIPKDHAFGGVVLPPLNLDPPEHNRIRKLVLPFFSPPAAARLEDATRGLVTELIDAFADSATCDVSQQFARSVPIGLMCRILDLPRSDEERFAGWVHRVVEAFDDQEQAMVAGFEMLEYFGTLADERAESDGPDLLSYLLHAEVDGERLTREEVLLIATTTLLAGIDTTWGMIASSLMHLAQNPDDQAKLRANPDQIPTACEEFFRVFAPVTIAREVVEDLEFHGTKFVTGDMVLASFPSACWDEEKFENAGDVVLDRVPNQHVAFGGGIHRCLGIHLARMELRVAVEEFLRRVPNFSLADHEGFAWARGPIRGPRRVVLNLEGKDER